MTAESTQSAQEILGTCFANDYYEYLKTYGLASCEGHELTGLCASSRLNVIDVTRRERELNPGMCVNWYVIEETNMDGIVFWQDSEGAIFQTAPKTTPARVFRSLAEYIIS